MAQRNWYLAAILGVLAGACGGSSRPAESAPRSGEQGAKSLPAAAEESVPGAAYSVPGGSGAAGAPLLDRSREGEDSAYETPRDRPGLATSWGEDRYSPVRSVEFRRDGDAPSAVTMLYYNDASGVRAMTHGDFVGYDDCRLSVAGGALTVTLQDADGRPLPAVRHAGRTYAVGEHDAHYRIRIDNHTSNRLEAVATVDGLDVIDGGEGSFDKRGYLVGAWDSVTIEGFRRSETDVASFRFGSVSDSYASRRGKSRNVGVIGVAFFRERGADWDWVDHDEVRRRETAEPFPARFAPPPPPRY